MGGLRKSVTIREVRGKFMVDYYDLEGKRQRPSFPTLELAEKHKDKIEDQLQFMDAMQKRGMVLHEDKKRRGDPTKLVEIEIRDAIKKYRELTKSSLTPSAFQNDKYYLEEFYGWCVEDRVVKNAKTGKPLQGTEPLIWMDEIMAIHMAEYQSWLLEKGNSASTVNRKFNTLKPFFANCKVWNFIAVVPTDGIKSKRLQKKVARKTWTKEQIREVLIELCPEASEMFLFLAAQGCRPGQGFSLTWKQVHWDERLIDVYSVKGGVRRDYQLPLSSDLFELLRQQYVMARSKKRARPDDPVFVNTKGRAWTKDSFGDHVRKATAQLKLEGLVPYGLRHTFITELLRANVNHRKVQLLAGHAKFETTTLYAQNMKGDELHTEIEELQDRRKLI